MPLQEGYVDAPDTSNWPKNPSQYPFQVGSNYQGEDPNGYWVYGPDNLYHPNQQIVEEYNQQSGISAPKPKKPGIGSVLGPVAVGTGALGLSQSFFQDPNKFVEGIGNLPGTVSNIFGFGSKPTAAAANAATQAAPAAASVAPSTVSSVGNSLSASVPFSFNPAATGISGLSAAAPAAPELLSAGWSGAAPAAPELISATAIPETGGLGSALSTAGQIIGPVVGGLGAYDLFSHNDDLQQGGSALQGAASGAAIGSPFGPPGMAIGAIIGGISGFLHAKFGSSKGKEQLERDAVRSHLQENGILDDNYMLTLADGTRFDLGKDGNALLDNVGANIDGKRQRHYYDVDFSDPANAQRVAALNPLAYIIAGGNDKRASDLVGMFTNAIASSKDKDSNIASLYSQFGMDHGTAYNTIDQMVKENKLDAGKADAFKNGIDELFGVGAYAGGNKPKPVTPPPQQAPAPQQAAPQPTPGQPQQSPKYPGTPRPQPPLPTQQQVTPKPQPQPVQQPPKAPFSLGPRNDAPRKPNLAGLRR